MHNTKRQQSELRGMKEEERRGEKEIGRWLSKIVVLVLVVLVFSCLRLLFFYFIFYLAVFESTNSKPLNNSE